MLDIRNAPSAVAQFVGDEATLLIKLGENEEGLYHQAAVGPVRGHATLTIFVHATSQILEKLRLVGTLPALAQSANGTTLYAELSNLPAEGCNPDVQALSLTLLDRCQDFISSPRFLPLT